MSVKNLRLGYSETAYIELPGHPAHVEYGAVSKMVCLDEYLDEVVPGFAGPRIHLDFNKEGMLIGIEVLCFGPQEPLKGPSGSS